MSARALRLACLFALALCAPSANAQFTDFRFWHAGRESGLADAIVTCVMQDRRGFLWIGTYESGLYRYDGYEFRRFAHDPRDPTSLANNRVWALAEDRDGRLWVGLWGHGLSRYDPSLERFESFRSNPNDPTTLSDDTVSALFCDSAGTLWVGTWNGLNRVVQGEDGTVRFERFLPAPNDARSLGDGRIWSIVESRGALVVGLRYAGLDVVPVADAQKSEVAFQHVRSRLGDPTTLSSDRVWCLATSADGGVWVGTDSQGICKYDPTTGACRRLSHDETGLKTYQIRSILEDSRGRLWVGARFFGLQCLDPQGRTIRNFPHDDNEPDSVSSNRVVSMFEDAEGLLWFGTWGGGLNRLDPWTQGFGLRRHHEYDAASLASDRVTAFCRDSDGALWVGTEAGLDRCRPGAEPEFEHFKVAPNAKTSLDDNWILALFEDRDAALWITTRGGGVYTLTPSERRSATPKFTRFVTPTGEEIGYTLSIAQDRDGIYWFGGRVAGLARWDGRTVTRFAYDANDPSSIGEGDIRNLLVDSTGSLWVTTRQSGLCRFDPKRQAFDRFSHDEADPSSISSDTTMAIAEDSKGTIWVGTLDGGLNRFDRATRTFTHTRESDGLASDSIASILVDDDDRLWLATSHGIDCFDPATGDNRLYDERDGLQSDNFTSTECKALRTADGLMYFGGTKGFNVIHPDRIEGPRRPPRVVVTDLLLGNRPVRIGSNAALPRALGDLDDLTLSHSDYLFGFEFAALSFREPGKNRYRYKLEGYDDRWIETDASDRKAVYTGIPPGPYTFRVMASSGDGVWNETGASVRIRIAPPWWRTWWFYALAVLFGAGAILAAVKLRIRALEQRGRDLEQLVAVRTEELATSERDAREAHQNAVAEQAKAIEANRAKSIFLANMSHELRTPLNAVIGFAQVLERRERLEGEDRENLRIIMRSGEHLLELINDVLSIAKIEAGRLTLVDKPFDLHALLRAVREIVGVRAESRGLEVAFEQEDGLPRFVVGDEGKLRQVLINLLGNAVKFTERGGVTLRARMAGAGRVRFEVEDTGKGISQEEMGMLFEAFAQTEAGRASREGTGLGLVISRQIVNLMGGDLEVRSEVGRGSAFAFEANLPKANVPVVQRDRRRVVGLAPDCAPPRILVTDDTDENRLLLVELLGPIGFELREARDGAEAVEVWREWRPDVVLMDMRMPVMDGREATERIRGMETEAGDGRRTLVVALTASAFEHERDGILARGADDFLTKPFRVEVLLELLAAHLGIEYRHEGENEPETAEGTAGGAIRERLAELPEELVTRLYRTLASGDIVEASRIATEIGAHDDELGRTVLADIRAFRIDELLSRLEAVTAGRS